MKSFTRQNTGTEGIKKNQNNKNQKNYDSLVDDNLFDSQVINKSELLNKKNNNDVRRQDPTVHNHNLTKSGYETPMNKSTLSN